MFVPFKYVTIDTSIAIFVFIFLISIYSSKFYTYVNELDYSIKGGLLDEFLNIYLIWTSFLLSFFFLLRFSGLSRGYIMLYTLIPPLILLFLRNSELASLFLGRSIVNETFVSFNLSNESKYRNLRIMALRKSLGNFNVEIENSSETIISTIDNVNKSEKINLIVISLYKGMHITKELQNYLLNLNKKVLIISKNNLDFDFNFLHRDVIIDDSHFIYFNNDIQYGSKFIIKRILDISLSLLFLILFFWIFLIVSIYIAVIDGAPLFVIQNRVGLHGKKFKMIKFRTMLRNSHDLREELDSLNKKSGPLFKIEDDPRLLKGSGFLRKYSIDELPQLLNVLKGDMSLVGPRPLFDTDTQLFNKEYMRRLNVLPGMTGLLQINNRNADDFETWFKYDVEYIENWSLLLDLKIIFYTIPALLKKDTKGV
tara:strand:- start:2286 stop:3560 length:1275 start_codon:yes stop_codon:yes gene_type:complete